MPSNGIHLLLGLEYLLDLLTAIVRDPVRPSILAPEVLGNLAGPVNPGCKRTCEFVKIIKSFSDTLCIRPGASLPAVKTSTT